MAPLSGVAHILAGRELDTFRSLRHNAVSGTFEISSRGAAFKSSWHGKREGLKKCSERETSPKSVESFAILLIGCAGQILPIVTARIGGGALP